MSAPVIACRGCGAPLPPPFLDLGAMPLANAYIRPEESGAQERRFPLATAVCTACHLVQLTETVPPTDLFSEYPYFSSFSDSFVVHAGKLAESLVRRLGLQPEHLVLEVASNDGYLLRHFQRAGIRVLGVEPARNVAAEATRRGVPTLNDFFTRSLVPRIVREFGQADVLVGCNVLAHVPDVLSFLQAARDAIRPGAQAVFEVPWLGALLEQVEFDTIYHEHVFYYSLSALEHLASRAGLEVQDVELQPVHGQSLRVFLQHPGTRPVAATVPDFLEREGRMGLREPARYQAFRAAVENLRAELVSLLTSLKAAGMSIAGYGAPAKGNTLLCYCGIGTNLLDFTVDRSPHKQGRLLPGTHIPIRPPAELLERMPHRTLILPWNIADEIAADQAEYVRRGGRFIIPIPHPVELEAR